jgi:carbon monoxide dehydrogenase subunit G
MEIDKTLVLPASPERAWSLLLDPQAMALCVPGMQSVQVVSPDEYTAEMVTKVSFITARMKLRTRIVERDAPRYLKAEGTGEDSGVASSMKQTTEMHLEPLSDGQSQLRLKVRVDVVGRLATFGLSALKTKADRLWDEFGQNLVRHLQSEVAEAPAAATIAPEAAAVPPVLVTPAAMPPALPPDMQVRSPAPAAPMAAATPPLPADRPRVSQPVTVALPRAEASRSWWQRLFGPAPASVIIVDWQRPDGSRLQVQWPAHQAQACLAWLGQLSKS